MEIALPGSRAHVVASELLVPPDIEAALGATDGDLAGGEIAGDRLDAGRVDPVVVQPGIYIVHGQVVIDGQVEIHSGVTIAPWVTIGLRAGDYRGATIERDVSIGTGANRINCDSRRSCAA